MSVSVAVLIAILAAMFTVAILFPKGRKVIYGFLIAACGVAGIVIGVILKITLSCLLFLLPVHYSYDYLRTHGGYTFLPEMSLYATFALLALIGCIATHSRPNGASGK